MKVDASMMEDIKIIRIGETDSTNRYLHGYDGEEGGLMTVVVAEYQSAGHGQGGSKWESEPGKNLLFSVMTRPERLDVRRQFVMLEAGALAVRDALARYAGGMTVKWPNDVYRDDRKICGMLLENDLCGAYIGRHISGIGVNINQETFRSNAPNPVSLKQITGREHDRSAILEGILQRVRDFYEQLRLDADGSFQAALAERYAAALYRREGFHPYRDADGDFRARLVGVEPDGRFVLEDEAGRVRKYLFKEVQYIL